MLTDAQIAQQADQRRRSQAIQISRWLLKRAIQEIESTCGEEWTGTLLDIAAALERFERLARAIEARERREK